MSERLFAALESIRSDGGVAAFDEASVRQVVVLQILSALGWDTYDRLEVTPDFAVGGGRVDYCLRIGGQSKVLIEVERGGADLSSGETALIGYSLESRVGLAALTNGLDWRFYLPSPKGASADMLFSDIRIASTDKDIAADVFIKALSKDKVASGSAVNHANELLALMRHAKLVNETLPAAWRSLLSDPDNVLVGLLADRVKAISNAAPSVSQVRDFLRGESARTPNAPPMGAPSGQSSRVERTRRPVSRNANRTEGRRAPSLRPRGFRFEGTRYVATRWTQVLLKVAEIMYERHADDFERGVAPLRGHSRVYYSRSRDDMTSPQPIGSSEWFVETNFRADGIREQCVRLIARFGYNDSDIEFI